MLEQCAELFRRSDCAELADLLTLALERSPLERPLDHKGPPATYMYHLQLSNAQRQQALRVVQRAAEHGQTLAGRGLGGFVEAWQEYAQSPDC